MADFERESICEVIPNILTDRYASSQMRDIFSPRTKTLLERDLWIAVMKAQAQLGLPIPSKAIQAYDSARNVIDLESIKTRESQTKHDVKAGIDEFNALSGGFEYIHQGMTSRDLTDNVEQMQIKMGMELIRDKTIAVLARLRQRAIENQAITMAARTHNIPAQPTLLGKRFATIGEELLLALINLEYTIDSYPLRGIKGPVGTQTDQLQLLKDPEKVDDLETIVAKKLGFKRVMGSVGQIYPRSLDFAVISQLFQLSAAPSNFANMVRLMAGQEQMDEGFSDGQSGSSAMPHKMNTRTAERVNSLKNVILGHVMMIAGLVGNQWYEGDVSDSATRRVAIPDAFYALDGILEATLHVLDEENIYPAVIQRELDRYMPFLTTTRVLIAALEHGIGREVAHKAIKRRATEAVRQMRNGIETNHFIELLARDKALGLSENQIHEALETNANELVGTASQQIITFAAKIDAIISKNPTAASYNPEPLI